MSSQRRWSKDLNELIAATHRTVLETREFLARLSSLRSEDAVIERSRRMIRESCDALHRVERTPPRHDAWPTLRD